MTNTAATVARIQLQLNRSDDGRVTAVITSFDDEDFDQFGDYAAVIEIDRCYFRSGVGVGELRSVDQWFISGLIDMNDHDCDDDCDVDHTNPAFERRFDIDVDDIDTIEFQ